MFRYGVRIPLLLAAGAAAPLLAGGCGEPGREVVVYCSLDRPYAEPILRSFEETAGIRVAARYDTEADKTTGLYNKLLEERGRPRADVFWNSEVLRTVLLAEEGVLAPYRSPAASAIPAGLRGRGDLWTGFAARIRVIAVNNRLVPEGEEPRSIADLADPRWKGRAAMALPLFGTASTHAGALWARLGAGRAEDLFRRIQANGIRIANGNAAVRDLVAAGEVAAGITDTDDAAEGIRRGDPIRIIYPDQSGPFPGMEDPLGAFLIPNTAALVQGGPDPGAGKALIDFLLSAGIEARLARSGSAQIPVRPGVEGPESLRLPDDLRVMAVRYEEAARGVKDSDAFLRGLFLR